MNSGIAASKRAPSSPDHLIGAAHRAYGCRYRSAARVFESLAWSQHWLSADHTESPHFLDLSARVGDYPVTADELRAGVARVADRDGVRKDVPVRRFVRLISKVLGSGADGDFVVLFLSHIGNCTGWGGGHGNRLRHLGIQCASP